MPTPPPSPTPSEHSDDVAFCADTRLFIDPDYEPIEEDLPLQIGQGQTDMRVSLSANKKALLIRRIYTKTDMHYKGVMKAGGVQDLFLSKENCEKLLEHEQAIMVRSQMLEVGEHEEKSIAIGQSCFVNTNKTSSCTHIRKMLKSKHTHDGLTFRFSELSALYRILKSIVGCLLPMLPVTARAEKKA